MIRMGAPESRKQRKRYRDKAVVQCALFVACLGAGYAIWGNSSSSIGSHGRSLLDCEDSSLKVNGVGGFLAYLCSVLGLFVCLAIVCDDYFVPSLEQMADPKHLDLSLDVAGATLMAAGGSAPELFTNLFGTFQESEVGIGTIVGSAVFNVLFVIGAICCVASSRSSAITVKVRLEDSHGSLYTTPAIVPMPLQCTPWPIVRDCLYYSVALLCLAWFMCDGDISMLDASLLFGLYVFYVVLMAFNERIYAWYLNKINKIVPPCDLELAVVSSYPCPIGGSESETVIDSPPAVSESTSQDELLDGSFCLDSDHDDENSKDHEGLWDFITLPPKSERTISHSVQWALLLPLKFALTVTIPTDQALREITWLPSSDRARHNLCYVQFFMSICWIGVFAYYVVYCTEVLGRSLGIPSVVMGLTFVAAGSSVPDLLSSLIVARQGEGDMAVSSSIGSNIFDILVGLPLPWILYMVYKSISGAGTMVQEIHVSQVKSSTPSIKSYHSHSYLFLLILQIESKGVWISIPLLLMTVVLAVWCMYMEKWRLTRRLGCAMFVFYAIFVVISVCLQAPFEQACIH